MAALFKNPELTDYFLDAPEVELGAAGTGLSVVEPYELGKVISLPRLKLELDLDFWGNLEAEEYAALRKLKLRGDDCLIDPKIRDSGPPTELLDRLQSEIQDIYRQIMPIYYALFSGYHFTRKIATCRLHTTLNRDLHFDTYQVDNPDHFARLFINLDRQPRIWQTSYTVQEIFELFGDRLPTSAYRDMPDNDLWSELRWRTFLSGPDERAWWDGLPRHVAYFQPGDVWLVDSRQVAHQIFYGRRALSIDFAVAVDSMGRPERYYRNILADFRKQKLQASMCAASTEGLPTT